MNLYEIFVPCVRNDERPIRTRCHREWDRRVRRLTGGLTIMPVSKGQWISPGGELFIERMIPVRIACDDETINRIADMTAAFYDQKAVMFYLVSDNVVIRNYE